MSSRFWVLFLLCPLLGLGQALPGVQEASSTKLYHLRYAQASHVDALMGPVGFNIRSDNALRVVLITAGAQKQAEAEQLIKELDQPESGFTQRDIEVTLYGIAASDKAMVQGVTPSAMEPVIKQLKSAFPYSGYEVLNTILVRSREGERASTSGSLRPSSDAPGQRPQAYDLRYQPRLDAQSAIQRTIHLDQFQFASYVENQKASFETSVDLREGQRVVIGKSNIDGGTSALFLVVTARVLGAEGESAK